jgi:hypothetical protein
MKRMLLAIMAVAVAISFSAPSFAGDEGKGKDKKDEKKGGHVMVYGDEGKGKDKKDEKKGGHMDTSADEGKKDKKDDKGKK